MNHDIRRLGGVDPREILDVPPDAGREEVVRAFRRKIRTGGHPDTGGDRRTFDRLALARDVLLDPARLASYEAGLHTPDRAGARPAPSRYAHRRGYAQPSAPAAPGPAAPGPAEQARTHKPPARPVPSASARRHEHAAPAAPMSPWAIAMVVLVFLGPWLWPLAIVIGHLAMRQINRTGRGGSTLVPVALLFLYLFTIPILLRLLVLLPVFG